MIHRALRLGRDALYLLLGKYGSQVVTLITLPYLTRTLGVEEFGYLSIGMATFFLGSIIVDFGMSQMLAASHGRSCLSRETREAYTRVRRSITGLIGALTALAIASGSPLAIAVSIGVLAGALSSLNEQYLLIGEAKFSRLMYAQLVSRISYLALIVSTLHLAPTAWYALSCLSVSNIVANVIIWAYTKAIPSVSGNPSRPYRQIFSRGGRITASRMLSSLTGQGSATLYALSIPAQGISIYAAGDKIVRAVQSIFDALALSLLPRMSTKTDHVDQYWRSVRTAALFAAGAGFCACLLLIMSAPTVVPLFYGSAFNFAVPVIQGLALLLPAVAVSTTLTNTVLYVNGQAGLILGTTIAGGITTALGVILSFWLATPWVMVYTAVATEWATCLTIIIMVSLLRSKSLKLRHLRRKETRE